MGTRLWAVGGLAALALAAVVPTARADGIRLLNGKGDAPTQTLALKGITGAATVTPVHGGWHHGGWHHGGYSGGWHHGGWYHGGYYRGFYPRAFYRPYFYNRFYYPGFYGSFGFYRPYVSYAAPYCSYPTPAYYYAPTVSYYSVPSVSYYYDACPIGLSPRPVVSSVLRILAGARDQSATWELAPASPGGTLERTYPYDGGPSQPVPLPPAPDVMPPAPPTSTTNPVTAPGRVVSLPAPVSRYAYPAYGQAPAGVPVATDRNLVIRPTIKR